VEIAAKYRKGQMQSMWLFSLALSAWRIYNAENEERSVAAPLLTESLRSGHASVAGPSFRFSDAYSGSDFFVPESGKDFVQGTATRLEVPDSAQVAEGGDMTPIHGTFRDGQIVFDDPPQLPEGTRVEVLPLEAARPSRGMREEDWPTTPAGIADLVAHMDQVEPGWLSPEDDAAWRAALREQKDLDKARFFDEAENLRRMWE
jgi:hypothetical protein